MITLRVHVDILQEILGSVGIVSGCFFPGIKGLFWFALVKQSLHFLQKVCIGGHIGESFHYILIRMFPLAFVRPTDFMGVAKLSPLFVISIFTLNNTTSYDLFQTLFDKDHIAGFDFIGKLPGSQHLVSVGAGAAVQLTHFGAHLLFRAVG